MKHIKLFEQISSALPKVFTTQEIKSMSQDEFFKVMQMYYREHNSEQAYTLMQVWAASHPEELNSESFASQLSKYGDFINGAEFDIPRSGKIEQMEDLKSILKSEKESEMFKKNWDKFINGMEDWISDKENSIQLLRGDSEKLKSGGKDALNSVSPEMSSKFRQWFYGGVG